MQGTQIMKELYIGNLLSEVFEIRLGRSSKKVMCLKTKIDL